MPLGIVRTRQREILASARAANARFADAGEAVLDAIVGLVEARAAWEEAYAHALPLLAEHDAAAAAAEVPGLAPPCPGPWLLERHEIIKKALADPALALNDAEAIPADAEAFVADWLLGFWVRRRQHGSHSPRLAIAS